MAWSCLMTLMLELPPADASQFPPGYYSFTQDPRRLPPGVTKPPYTQTEAVCSAILEPPAVAPRSLDNLCGDLNTGELPLNPMGQSVLGASYPFELLKNHTLALFSSTLPILKEDSTLPKVAKFVQAAPTEFKKKVQRRRRPTRSLGEEKGSGMLVPVGKHVADEGTSRQGKQLINEDFLEGLTKGVVHGLTLDHDTASRILKGGDNPSSRGRPGLCHDNWGIFCRIYNSLMGRQQRAADRSDTSLPRPLPPLEGNSLDADPEAPMTPCPSSAEYVTPVFARNHEGVWRYVVQIPYEGYFTQTVEVTRCKRDTCHFLRGSCLASPRWVSLLVAEIFYPDAGEREGRGLSAPPSDAGGRRAIELHGPPLSDRERESRQMQAPPPRYCDGVDHVGCFQVRLYYDWFLVSGSCKCWRKNAYGGDV